MQTYEYKVIPAPNRGEKAPGVKTAPDRFAHALASAMNDLARHGWEYLRADTLPSEERSGLTRRTTVYHTVLVFRRPVAARPEEAPRKLLLTSAPQGRAPALSIDPPADPGRTTGSASQAPRRDSDED